MPSSASRDSSNVAGACPLPTRSLQGDVQAIEPHQEAGRVSMLAGNGQGQLVRALLEVHLAPAVRVRDSHPVGAVAVERLTHRLAIDRRLHYTVVRCLDE